MKKLLRNKKGVTVLEGIIALGLLAIITAGSFGVLLSVSRQATQPDIREEMTLAIEKANDKLKALVLQSDSDLAQISRAYLPGSYQVGSSTDYNLCPNSDPKAGFQVGTQLDIACLLPPICDKANSYFYYQIGTKAPAFSLPGTVGTDKDIDTPNVYQIAYDISCNGYQL